MITETFHARYVLTLKGNQPTLYAQVKSLPWRDVPASDTTIDTSRGRVVIRKLQLVTLKNRVLPDWPGLKQVGRLTRERIVHGVTGTEVVYVLTSLPPFAAGPGYLAETIRGHWSEKNKVHWVRDVTFRGDKNQVRYGFVPRNLAALTNVVLAVFCLVWLNNIAESALELHACHRLIRQVLEAV